MKTNWQTKKLGDVCEIELGKTPYRGDKSFWDGEKKSKNVWLSIADLLKGQGKIVSDSKEYISDKGAKISKIVKEGTLLVSFKLTLGRLAFAGKDLYTNEAIASLEIKNEKGLSKEFLYYFLTFFDWNKATEGNVKVKGRTLNKSKLKQIKIPLPPLATQKAIIKILDQTFESISKSKENAEKNLKNSKELFESYLEEIFSNPKEDWEEKKLRDACEFIRGPFGSSLKKSFFKEKGYAVYEQRHAIYNSFDNIRYFIDEKKFDEMKRFELFPNDLIMSCSGTMGKIAIAPFNIQKGIINQALLKLSTSKKLLNVYLKLWMESTDFQRKLREFSLGAAIQNVASVKILKDIKIRLPPISEQTLIVSKLNSLSKEVKKLETIYKQKIKDLEELKKSMLQKAFNGELND